MHIFLPWNDGTASTYGTALIFIFPSFSQIFGCRKLTEYISESHGKCETWIQTSSQQSKILFVFK